ncbi:peptidoglycan-binding domain-containing protein [Vibrio parahaemolyticus]|uniref:peptidoglycan-binding domain-containing protein n=1 Tax=Vibrio parahaemolyticus TaxID=670 RepID=UPI001C0ECEC3|nr:peptidoglycan-binding protein [Vibrio parahaemolyticus]
MSSRTLRLTSKGAVTISGKQILLRAFGPITIRGDFTVDEEDQVSPTLPSLKPGQAFHKRAYENRLNAVLFNGKANKVQRNCIYLFSIAFKLAELAGKPISYQYLAYAIVTAYHETAFTMKSIEEYGKGEGHSYGEPHEVTGQTYYGRSYSQLTWYENYLKAQGQVYNRDFKVGEVDFIYHPELVLEPYYGAQVTIFGMLNGWFTGKKLSDYWLADGSYDYVNARRIINGTDKAQTIAGYAREVESAILLAYGHEIERDMVSTGSRGADVCELQLALGVSADGVFGNGTKTALEAFQQANQLTPDGICGSSTWDAIDTQVYGISH